MTIIEKLNTAVFRSLPCRFGCFQLSSYISQCSGQNAVWLPRCLPRAELAVEECECLEVNRNPSLSLEQVFIGAGLGFQILLLLLIICLSPLPHVHLGPLVPFSFQFWEIDGPQRWGFRLRLSVLKV